MAFTYKIVESHDIFHNHSELLNANGRVRALSQEVAVALGNVIRDSRDSSLAPTLALYAYDN